MTASPSARRMLILPQPVRDAIARHAQEAYPFECCGLVVGSVAPSPWARRTVPCGNTSTERLRDRFSLDPLVWLRVHRTLQPDEQVLGVYHSHPDGAAHPSRLDSELADPGLSYLIVAVQAGQAVELRSWRHDAARHPSEEALVMPA